MEVNKNDRIEGKNLKLIKEPFYFNEKVDVYKSEDGSVRDAQIVSIRGALIKVKYINSGYEENLNSHSEDTLILKQCKLSDFL